MSSSDEVSDQRDRVAGLIEHSFNPQLERTSRAYIALIRWEDVVPQQVSQGRVNEIFVQRVRDSHLTMVLLGDELRPGTKEELEAGLEEQDVNVAVVRFAARDGSERHAPDEISDLLKPHQEHLLYKETGPPDSEQAIQAVVSVLFSMALAAYDRSQPQKVHSELR